MTFSPEAEKSETSKQGHASGRFRGWLILLLILCLSALGVWIFFIKPEEAAKKKQTPRPPWRTGCGSDRKED